jgi:hypothetical protein
MTSSRCICYTNTISILAFAQSQYLVYLSLMRPLILLMTGVSIPSQKIALPITDKLVWSPLCTTGCPNPCINETHNWDTECVASNNLSGDPSAAANSTPQVSSVLQHVLSGPRAKERGLLVKASHTVRARAETLRRMERTPSDVVD